MATHSSVLAWRIPGMAEPVGGRLWGHTELDTTEQLALFHYQRQERKAYSQEKEKLTETMREVS